MKRKVQKKVRSRRQVREIRLTRKVTLRKALALLSYERPYNVTDPDDDLKF